MSGSKWQAQVPSDLDADLVEYKRERGLDDDAEAVRQLLRMGAGRWKDEQQSSSLAERPLLEVGRVGVVAAAVGALRAGGRPKTQRGPASLAVLFVGVAGYGVVGVARVRRDR
jgi:hypothetical protein